MSKTAVRFYEGNKSFHSEPPLLFVRADVTGLEKVGEYLVITGLETVPHVEQTWTICADEKKLSTHLSVQEAKERLSSMTAEEILEWQAIIARDGFENAISKADAALHREFFWTGFPFQFVEINQARLLMRLRVWVLQRKQDEKTLLKMHRFTESVLRNDWSGIATFNISGA